MMKSKLTLTGSKLLLLIVLFALVSKNLLAGGDQLSTVFVLETNDPPSDSFVSHHGGESSSPANNKTREENTRIITDDGAPDSASSSNKSHSKKHADVSSPVVSSQQANSQQQEREAKHRDVNPPPTNRRLEQESQPEGQTRQRVAQTATRSTNSNQQRPPKSTTSTSHQDDDDNININNNNSTPKTEERLLISITSEEEESYNNNKAPHKNNNNNNHHVGGLSSLTGSSHTGDDSQPVNQHQKRKPSITISIHDPSKQGSQDSHGTPSVILRPSENGQSIVISTVGINGNSKPSAALTPSGHHNNDREPYRDPIANGIHREPSYTSTTNRPSLISEILSNSRPISSLIERPRPPIQTSLDDDRPPSRPIDSDQPYDSQRPSTSRPIIIRPTQEPHSQSGYNNGDQDAADQSGGLRPPANEQSAASSSSKFPLNDKNCGLVHETRIVGGEEADPADFLWMAAIIKSKPSGLTGEARPFCGGSLITRRHILTAAHCLEGLAPRDVLVRLGSYDFDDSTASSLSADFAIDQFRVPAQYSKKTHVADIAIMRLKTPLSTNDNYKTVCMPQPRRSYVGSLGTVTGYGSQSQTFRRAAPKLRQVVVPIWENRKCSVVYKKNLTESFLCAGYEEGGKDACQGDSGGPLMTDGPNERMMVVGVVSHGIGCGSPGYPGVYTRTTTFLEWIEKNTRE